MAINSISYDAVPPAYKEIKEAYYESYNYEKMQDYNKAIKALALVSKEYPKSYTVNIRLGWLYYLKNKYANSIHHYQKAIEIAPDSTEAKLGYSYPLLAQKKYDEVATISYQIMQKDHYNYSANLNLAFALRMQGKHNMAKKITEKMTARYPTNISFLTELALINYAQENKETAYNIFSDILILDPNNSTAKSYLGIK
ncbi:MAG: tetratricopeptide repeat protein [Candidatus Eremiobacteraeota bacterium]|nr:tetratricopeptide repeat protein [Candidatus Eremiobacteraeota bacterium]